jgi:hypothetical protein
MVRALLQLIFLIFGLNWRVSLRPDATSFRSRGPILETLFASRYLVVGVGRRQDNHPMPTRFQCSPCKGWTASPEGIILGDVLVPKYKKD